MIREKVAEFQPAVYGDSLRHLYEIRLVIGTGISSVHARCQEKMNIYVTVCLHKLQH